MNSRDESKDLGLMVLDNVRQRMGIDAEWSTNRSRGFKWWGWNTGQEAWAEEPFTDMGMEVVRLHARADMIRGFDGSDKHMTLLKVLGMSLTTSGLVRHPEDQGRIQLASSMYVHADNRSWAEELFGHVVALQAAEASIIANQMPAGFGLVADVSEHPESGAREEMDEILDFIAGFVNPMGREQSQWAGDEMDKAVEMFQRPPCVMATGDGVGLSAEFPYPAPSGTSLLQLTTQEPNPRVGHGLLSLLHIPDSGSDPEKIRAALELNERELRELSKCHFLGSWTASPMGLSYVSFFPNVAYRPGLLKNLCMNAQLRACWISEDVHGYSWNEHFEDCRQLKMDQIATLMGGEEEDRGRVSRPVGKGGR